MLDHLPYLTSAMHQFLFDLIVSMQKRFSPSESQKAALFQRAPPWFRVDGATYTTSKGKVHINFAKPCSCRKRQQTVTVGKACGLERAELVGEALKRRHGEHQVQTATAAAPATDEEVSNRQVAEIERLEKALKVQRAASAEFEYQAGMNKRKFNESEHAVDELRKAKGIKTMHDNKRCAIDPANRTPFGAGVKSAKMRGERGTGIEELLEVHCEGSEAKLLDIVYAIIEKYKLKAQVKGHFGITVNQTNAYIVARAAAALQELKHCRKSMCSAMIFSSKV
jgi:hypothetical protein